MYSEPGKPSSDLRLREISDSQTYGKTIHKLAVFDPVEVFQWLYWNDYRLSCPKRTFTLTSPNCVVLSRRICPVRQSSQDLEKTTEKTLAWITLIKYSFHPIFLIIAHVGRRPRERQSCYLRKVHSQMYLILTEDFMQFLLLLPSSSIHC